VFIQNYQEGQYLPLLKLEFYMTIFQHIIKEYKQINDTFNFISIENILLVTNDLFDNK